MSKQFINVLMLIVVAANLFCGRELNDGTEAYKRKDYVTALSQASKAAEQGNAKAQYNLGIMYSNGHGVPENKQEAEKWYRLAADQGNATNQFLLGNIYDNGQGVPQDYFLAYLHYSLAATLAEDQTLVEKYTSARNIVFKKLTPSQQEEGQKMAAIEYKKIQKRMKN